MIYHGTTPIIAMFQGVEPIVATAKGEEVVYNETNFKTADNHVFKTSDGHTFMVREE